MAGKLGKVLPDYSWGPGASPAVGAWITCLGSMSISMVMACIATVWGDRYQAALWALVLGVGFAFAAAGSAAAKEQPTRVVLYRAGCWAAGGVWAAWWAALSQPGHLFGTGPWSWLAIGSVIFLGCVLSAWGKWLSRLAFAEELIAIENAPVPTIDLELTREDQIAAEWGKLITAVTRIPGLEIKGVELWKTGKGFTLDIDLPTTGVTMMDVKGHELAIATAAKLDEGCNVEVRKGDIGRGSFLMDVGTENALKDDYPIEKDFGVRSIMDPISLGKQVNGLELGITPQYKTTVLIGQKDSGKSTELNAIISEIVKCDDALIIGIDTTGAGRAFRPWLRAWKEGRSSRPAIDLVAPTEEFAIAACRGVRNLIAGRTAAYDDRLQRENSDKIIPASDLPAIIVIVDEFGTLPQSVKDALVDLSDTGRGASVSPIICALRAQSGYLPRDLIAQAYNRVAMRVTDEAELQYLFDSTWKRGRFDPSSMPYAGVGVAAEGATVAEGFKGWWSTPADIDQFAVATADRRPDMDVISADLMDAPEGMKGLYARRWELTLPIIFPGAEVPKVRERELVAAVASENAGMGGMTEEELAFLERIKQMERDEPKLSLEESQAQMAAAMRRAREAAALADAEYMKGYDATRAAREAEIAQLNALYEMSPAEDPEAHPTVDGDRGERVGARERVRQLIQSAGADGLLPGVAHEVLEAEGYPTSRQTVMRWVKADLSSGLLSQPNGERTAYVWKGRS